MRRSGQRVLAAAACLALLGCTGNIGMGRDYNAPNGGAAVGGAAGVGGGAGGAAGGAATSGSGGVGAAGTGMPIDPGTCAPRLPQRLVLLSDLQHANAVSSMLGEEARDPGLGLSDDTKPFSQKGLVVSTSLVHGRIDQAQFAAATLDERFTALTGCPEDGDATCARGYLETFTERAFRRPVGVEEIDDLMEVFELGAQTDFKTGVKLAVQAVMGAPSFTYRSEIGASGSNGVAQLSAYEVASELSFMLTDAPPDDMLFEAAKSGTLLQPGQLEAHVARMLELPEVQESLKKTLMAAWQIGNVFGVVKDPGMFPEYSAALQSSMYRETDAFVQAVLWTRDAPVSELLTSRETFVDAALAAIYDVPFEGDEPTELSPVTLPEERAGLLTQASLLTLLSRTDNTSVVARGLFVRGALLCLPKIGSPPEDLADEITMLLQADMTERERAEVRATTQPCGGCHANFDRFGLLLESYDPIGRFRTEIEGEPIDSNTDLTGLGNFEGNVADAVAFAQLAADSPDFTACLTRNLIAYGTGDDALLTRDCQVSDAVAQLPASPTMRDLVRAATSSPALLYRTVEETP